MIILGVDPGLSGGLALVRSGDRPTLIAVSDVPTTGEKAKRRVDVPRVLEFIRSPGRTPDHAYIERAQSMPDQGSSSGFRYGRAVGALEACVEGLMIPSTIIEPTAWKKAHGLIRPSDFPTGDWSKIVKENSRQRAIKLFPGAPGFERRMDHGKAESCLIAWYGLMLLRGAGLNRLSALAS